MKTKLSFLFLPILVFTRGISLFGDLPSGEKEFKELDRWYEVFLGESKVGYAHSTMKLEKTEVISQSTFMMSIKRAGVSIKIQSTEKTKESLSGQILSFSGEMKMAGVPITKKGWVDGSEIVVQEKQYFRETTKRYPLNTNGKMTWGLLKFLRESGFNKEGREFETQIYSADFGMAAPTKAKIKSFGECKIQINQKPVRVFRTEIKLHSNMGEVKTVNWLDSDGFSVKTKMQMGGIPIEIKQSSKSQAKRSSEKTDFLYQTLLSLPQGIPENSKSVRFKIEILKGKLSSMIPQSRNQKVTQIDDQNFIVDVKMEKWSKSFRNKTTNLPIGQEFRLPNVMIDSEDKFIHQLAKQASRGSKNIIELSEKLYSFAREYIHRKNFSVGFATAGETARSREGDCTEHAVFLAALGRSMGIPTRVASGLVFMNEFQGKENVMGFHMWTEFHIKGQWIALDSALGKMGSHTERITISVSSLEQDSLNELGFRIAQLIGNIKVQIEKII